MYNGNSILLSLHVKTTIMKEIISENSQRLIQRQKTEFKRFLFDKIDWNNRLIGIRGARGTGKTTLMLQWLKSQKMASHEIIYLSLDDLFFLSNDLIETIDLFYKEGGKILVLDEVHKYPNWARALKNIYDFYPDLKIIFSGSSIIEISTHGADLGRRAILYDLPGLSYREYLEMKKIGTFDALTLNEILENINLSSDLLEKGFKPLEYFQQYLRYGYYPFGIEHETDLYIRINQLLRTIVENDMASIPNFDIRNASKILQLISIISKQVPFKPNISSLAEKTGMHRNTIQSYLQYLEQSKILHLLYPSGISTSIIQKPEKIYLDNSVLLNAIGGDSVNSGTLRETFFLSQLKAFHKVSYPKTGDFLVDDLFLFEIGGAGKGFKQVENFDRKNSFVVADKLEYNAGKKIPLWLFGFLY